MAIRTDRHGLEILDEDTCWQLLSTNYVGRLAVSVANQPEVFPVNYVVDDHSLVFVTAEGTKLAAAVLGAGVAFEIDNVDPMFQSGWSVLVRGKAREVEALDELMHVQELPLAQWSSHDKRRWVRIAAMTVTGRRIVHHSD